MSNARAIKARLFDELKPHLAERGFTKTLKSLDEFIRPGSGVDHRIGVTLVGRAGEVALRAKVRFEDVEQTLARLGFSEDPAARHESTVNEALENLYPRDGSERPIAIGAELDLEEAIPEILRRIDTYALPFLERYSTKPALLRGLQDGEITLLYATEVATTLAVLALLKDRRGFDECVSRFEQWYGAARRKTSSAEPDRDLLRLRALAARLVQEFDTQK